MFSSATDNQSDIEKESDYWRANYQFPINGKQPEFANLIDDNSTEKNNFIETD
jgi:hypothetical protein